jgi:hypothetical protein
VKWIPIIKNFGTAAAEEEITDWELRVNGEKVIQINSHGRKQDVAKLYGQRFIKALDKERYNQFYKVRIPGGLPLNDMKLASLYVDCYDGHPLRPTKLFGKKGSVASIATIVGARIKSFVDLHSTIDKSIRFVEEALKHSIQVDGKDATQILIEYFRQRA